MGVWRYLGTIFLLLYLTLSIVIAQSDKTNLELIESIKSVPLSPEIYSDVVNIRSLSITFLASQSPNTMNADYNKFAESVEKFLVNFNDFFQKSRNSQPADHEEAIIKAISLRDETFYLKSLSNSSPDFSDAEVADIIYKENSSLNSFLDEQTQYFEDAAEKENAVPLKIEYLEYVVKACQNGANSNCELSENKLSNIELNFSRDMKQASELSGNADEMIRSIEKNKEGLFDLLSNYAVFNNALNLYLKAIEIYNNNENTDKTLPKLPKNYADAFNQLIKKNRDAKELSSSIFKSLIISLLEILAPLLFIILIFMIGFKEWKKDFTNTKLNKVIRKGMI
jgi:hypothetical protein